MSPEDLGFGAGGGIVGTLLAYLGFKQRMDAQDARIKDLEDNAVYKDVHGECSRSWHGSIDRMDKKLDTILEKLGQR